MLKRLLCASVILLAPVLGFSASIGVTPVNVHFSPGEKIEVVTFSNKGDDVVTLQAQVFVWSQKNGKNIYTPTKDLVTSPAMFMLKPNQKQLLRVALRHASTAAEAQQKTYRVFFTQILPLKVKQVSPDQVNTKLKISLPIFIDLAPGDEKIKLTAAEVNHRVTLTNSGNVTRLINQIRWMKSDGVTPAGNFQDVFIYLLPGKSYTLTEAAQSHTLQVLTNRKLEVLKIVA